MMNRRREALTNIFFKYVQIALSLVTGIVMVPVYLHYISPSDYGAWLACFSVVVWLAVFDPGIGNILIQKISAAVGKKNFESINVYLTVGLSVSILVAVIVIFIGWVGAGTAISSLGFIDKNAKLVEAFRIAAVSTGFILLGYALVGSNYALHASTSVGIIYIGATILKITTILILLKTGLGFISLAYGELVSSSTILLFSFFNLIYRLHVVGVKGRLSFKKGTELLGLFSISFGARLSKLIIRNLDNVFIAHAVGPEAVTVYSITATVPRQTENLIGQPISALRPAMAHLSGCAEITEAINYVTRLLRLVIWTLGMIVAGLCLFNSDFIRLWVGEKLFAGNAVNYLLVGLFFLHVWTNVFGMLGFSFGDIRRNNKFEIIYAILLIPALWLGASTFGLIGLVCAHIVVILLTTAWYFPLSVIRLLKVDHKIIINLFITILKSLFVSTIIILLFSVVSITGWASFILWLLCMCAAYILLLCILETDLRREFHSASRLIVSYLRNCN